MKKRREGAGGGGNGPAGPRALALASLARALSTSALPPPPPHTHTHTHSFFAEVPRRSRALAHLPGPEYGFLGLASAMKEKTIHRDLTRWANEHGPVYRFR